MAKKKVVDPAVSAAAAAMGRKGGPARAKSLTKAERSAIAKQGAEVRWAAAKKAKAEGGAK